MQKAKAERLRVVTAGLLVAAAAASAAVWLSLRADRLERTADRVSTEIINLERSIGYAGFIHAYKNYILRPGEDRYWTDADIHYRQALEAFDAIEEITREERLQISLAELRNTMSLYRTMLDLAREARAEGASVLEIDELVRISDEEANFNLSELQRALKALLANRLQTARTWRLLNILAVVAALVSISLVAVYYRRKDIEIERKAITEVTRARDQLSAVFSAVRSGIVGLDQNRSIVTLNPPARHLLGGISLPAPFAWPERIRFLDGAALAPLIASADPVNRALSGTDIRDEVHLMTRGGSGDEARYVRISSARIDDPASQVAAVVVLDDITDQERNRQQIEREQRLDALGQLTGGIAHDFNNVLATILYANELAAKSVRNEETKQLLHRALASVERGRQLTERLLAFARRQPGRAMPHDVASVFRELREFLRPTIEAQVELHFDPGPPDLCVYCDVGQLENALLNLVLNARDAILSAGDRGSIRLAAQQVLPDPASGPHGKMMISVSDDGPGMSRAVRERATDPFFTTKSATGGNGLGLSMVYGFVQQAKGELRILSDEGQGTTVQLYLPASQRPGATAAGDTDSAVIPGNGEVVLLVEDEPELIALTSTVLQELGYRTVGHPSGTAAWDWIEQGGEFDVLLTDVVMPGSIGGIELARKLRERHPQKPALLMSGYTGLSEAERGGAGTIVLQKPCTPQALAGALRSALRNAAPRVIRRH